MAIPDDEDEADFLAIDGFCEHGVSLDEDCEACEIEVLDEDDAGGVFSLKVLH